MSKKTYTCKRTSRGVEARVRQEDCETYLLKHHVRHSPDGFEFGYGGSGPSELARCILLDCVKSDAHYQDFKWTFIAGAKGNRLEIREELIRTWLKKKEASAFNKTATRKELIVKLEAMRPPCKIIVSSETEIRIQTVPMQSGKHQTFIIDLKPLGETVEEYLRKTIEEDEAKVCVWCRKNAGGFRDELSAREFKISGLCQECQDKTFRSD